MDFGQVDGHEVPPIPVGDGRQTNRRPGGGRDAPPAQILHEDPGTAVDRRRTVTPQRDLVRRRGVPDVRVEVVRRVVHRLLDHDPVAGDLRDARRRRHREHRHVALHDRRDLVAQAEVVVLAVEDDPVRLVALGRDLRRARGARRSAARWSCRARRTPRATRARCRWRAPTTWTAALAWSRSARVSAFESRIPRWCSGRGTTAATVTGPAHAPRPTSSMPQTTRVAVLPALPLDAEASGTPPPGR